MNRVLSIGLGQISIFDGDIVKNQGKIEKIIKEGSQKKIDIICLPELCLTGYDFELIKDIETDRLGKSFFARMSKKYEIAIVAGLSNMQNNKVYDSVGIWDSEGDLIHIHDKIQLWAQERDFFDIGNKIEVIEYKGWKIGIAVCADLGFPEISRIFALKGAEIIFFPSAWVSPYSDLWELMLRARAAENQLYTVGINRVGKGISTHYFGYSMITDPYGKVVCEYQNDEEKLLIGNANKHIIKERREEIPWLKYRVPKSYMDLIEV